MVRPRDVAAGVALFPARTPTLPPATHTNSYALGGREVLLVEPATPYDGERRAWLEWARGLGAAGRRIVGVLATHHHVDHIGGAAFLCGALGVPLLAHAITIDRLRSAGAVEGVDLEPVADGQVLSLDSASGARWRVLQTPGHAPGHVCLHDEDAGTLVAGDMVANGSTILIPPDDGGDMAAYMTQLRRLDALGATVILPAHGEPIDDPHALLTHYVAHREARERKILDAHAAMRARLGRVPSDDELVPFVYDDTPRQLWPLARMSLEAHTVKLRREGRL